MYLSDNGIAMSSARSRSQQLEMLAILPVVRQGQWLEACLLCGGGRDIRISQVTSPREAAAALRQHSFDLLVLWHEGQASDTLEGWEQLADIAGHTGFVALGMHVVEGWNEPLIDAGAIACLDMDQTEPVTLVNALRMAGELETLRSESQLWEQERHRKREREARELDRVLASQRSLLDRLDHLGSIAFVGDETRTFGEQRSCVQPACAVTAAMTAPRHPTVDPLQSAAGQQYLTALKSFIFEEGQAASKHIAVLAQHYASQSATSSTIMRVHLAAVTHLTADSGAGSLRHCLGGADRFLMELLMRMVDQQISQANSSVDATAASDMRIHSATSPLAAA